MQLFLIFFQVVSRVYMYIISLSRSLLERVITYRPPFHSLTHNRKETSSRKELHSRISGGDANFQDLPHLDAHSHSESLVTQTVTQQSLSLLLWTEIVADRHLDIFSELSFATLNTSRCSQAIRLQFLLSTTSTSL